MKGSARRPKRTLASLEFSLLDQGTRVGPSPAEYGAQIFALAREAEALGFQRFLLTEHHAPGSSSASPEILVAAVGQATSRIRVGTAGILLPYYSELKVAENVALLSSLFPNRVDIGLGKGPGADTQLQQMLYGEGRSRPDNGGYVAKLRALVTLIAQNASLAPGQPSPVTPRGSPLPRLALMGLGGETARLAGELGLEFMYGHHLNPGDPSGSYAQSVLLEYRRTFRPSVFLRSPHASMSFTFACARTPSEAIALDDERKRDVPHGYSIVGTPSQCRDELAEHARRCELDGVILATSPFMTWHVQLDGIRLLAAKLIAPHPPRTIPLAE